jgi:type II secretory pathway predicted ATPase ExeA
MSVGPLSYEPFFGLKKKPFSLASDPEFLYESPSHVAALQALLAGIRRREGLLALTGDIGTGKTTICRAVLRNLDRTTFSAFIPDPFASREDLLKMLLIDFGVTSIQDFTTGPLASAGRTELSYLLASFLDTLVPLDAFVVVFIDEAQNMSLSLMEEVRVLSDSIQRQGQLQVVFVGQLELLEKFKSPTMRQMDQRVSAYTRLDPLAYDDVIGYVHHRLEVAGASQNRPMFVPQALSLIHEASGGIPRLINRICDRALHAAYLLRSPLIDRGIVASILDDGTIVVDLPRTEDSPEESSPAAAYEDDVTPFATQVDEWLTQVDVAAAPPPEATSIAPPEEAVRVADDFAAKVPTFVPAMPDEPHRSRQPDRYMEKLGRRWARAAVIATVAFLGLNVIVAAAAYVPQRLTGLLDAGALPPVPDAPRIAAVPIPVPAGPTEPQPEPVAVPAAAGTAVATEFIIAAGAFRSTARAEQVREDLLQAGFQAYTRPAANGARSLHRVLVGPFQSRESAQKELERLRSGGDFVDAVVMPVRTERDYAP